MSEEGIGLTRARVKASIGLCGTGLFAGSGRSLEVPNAFAFYGVVKDLISIKGACRPYRRISGKQMCHEK